MLKIHSFLQRIKRFLCDLLPGNKDNYKSYLMIIAYTMITLIILMTPNYIYGLDNSYSQAMGLSLIVEQSKPDVEETANEAIIRVTQPNPELQTILYNYSQNLTVGNSRSITNVLLTSGKLNKVNLVANEKQMAKQITKIAAVKEKQLSAQVQAKMDGNKEAVAVSSNKVQATIEKTDIKQTMNTNANSKVDRADAKKTVDVNKKKTEQETIASVKYAINLSKNEIEILQRIVEAEATGEDIKGKMLVANVIMNRVNDEEFPDTVEKVVFQKSGSTYQFSPIKDKRYWSVKISKDTIAAVDRVLQGGDSSQGALYFSARSRAEKTSMSWFDRNLKFLYKHGGHEFFKNK